MRPVETSVFLLVFRVWLTTGNLNHLYERFSYQMASRMGSSPGCDDGSFGWKQDILAEGGYSENVECSAEERKLFNASSLGQAVYWRVEDPQKLTAGLHRCMDKTIYYDDNEIPTHGYHRPVWPVYGEYKFLPPHRWVHGLEHGAIVGLYHPCTPAEDVQALRVLLSRCLRRHLLTPSSRLDHRHPMALVAWGKYVKFGRVNAHTESWITANAIHAPEFLVWVDGDYEHLLQTKATVVSDEYDSRICPTSKSATSPEVIKRRLEWFDAAFEDAGFSDAAALRNLIPKRRIVDQRAIFRGHSNL